MPNIHEAAGVLSKEVETILNRWQQTPQKPSADLTEELEIAGKQMLPQSVEAGIAAIAVHQELEEMYAISSLNGRYKGRDYSIPGCLIRPELAQIEPQERQVILENILSEFAGYYLQSLITGQIQGSIGRPYRLVRSYSVSRF